ncbi:MAG: GAF domain-containing protein [Phycisphaerales bacterium]|nr:GAF domain-containing protein [Phycisphaerales bacterium]
MSALPKNWTAELNGCANVAESLAVVVRAFGGDTGTLHLKWPDGLLHLEAVVGAFPPPVMDAIRTIPIGKGMAGLAAQRREPVTVCNLQSDTSVNVRPGARATGAEGAIASPCFGGVDGNEVVGVLGVANFAPREFSPIEHLALLECGRALCGRWSNQARC